jgi:hypothetical protein
MGTRVLVGGLSGDEFAEIDQLFDSVQDLAGLFWAQPFPVEGIQDFLNHAVRDFSREVGNGKGLIVGGSGGAVMAIGG